MGKSIIRIFACLIILLGLSNIVFCINWMFDRSDVIGTPNQLEKEVIDNYHGYSITYNLDGGILKTENPTEYGLYSANITLNNPAKDGYEFIGWTGSNGENPQLKVTICTGSAGDLEFTANYKHKYYFILTDNILEWYIEEDEYEFFVNNTYLEHITGVNSLDVRTLHGYCKTGPNTFTIKFGTKQLFLDYMYYPTENFENLTLNCYFSLRSDGYRISARINDITMIELGYSFNGELNYWDFQQGIIRPDTESEYLSFLFKYICATQISTGYFDLELKDISELEFFEGLKKVYSDNTTSKLVDMSNHLVFTFYDENYTKYVPEKILLNVTYYDMYTETLFYDGVTVNLLNFSSGNKCYMAYFSDSTSTINMKLYDINGTQYLLSCDEDYSDNSLEYTIGEKTSDYNHSKRYPDINKCNQDVASYKIYLNSETYICINNVCDMLLYIARLTKQFRDNYEISINNTTGDWGKEIVVLESIDVSDYVTAYHKDSTEVTFNYSILINCKTSSDIIKVAMS